MSGIVTKSRSRRTNPGINQFIIGNVRDNPTSIASLTAKEFGVSRVTINRYLDQLVEGKILEASGKTKARRYILAALALHGIDFDVGPGLQEDVIWRNDVAPHIQPHVSKNVFDICQYGVCEMVNNVIDHSEAATGRIFLRVTAASTMIVIRDMGVGIFEKIRKACNLDDARHALLELSKGKLTTDSSRHTGEGIFFTSRMFQEFRILSGDLIYTRTREEEGNEWLFDTENRDFKKGTTVILHIPPNVDYTDREIFKQFEDDEHRFAKTHVPVMLAKYGDEQLVSRSQARRVLTRVNKFSEAIFDFTGVPKIGQAFADEIFRVYANEHPEIEMYFIGASREVDETIMRAKAGEAATQMDLPLKRAD